MTVRRHSSAHRPIMLAGAVLASLLVGACQAASLAIGRAGIECAGIGRAAVGRAAGDRAEQGPDLLPLPRAQR